MYSIISRTSLIVTILLCIILNYPVYAQTGFKFKTIVIDPGHGGEPGAISGSVKEKDIVLKVAKLFGAKIKKEYPHIKVVYTREVDKTVALHARSSLVNDSKADLFVSIHANSAGATSASGTETFIMGYDKSEANMAVAMKENNVVTYEKDYSVKYEGFDPSSVESYIIFSLMQHSYISQSSIFASYLQEEYTNKTGLRNRGVKQAPFLVLWQSATPSVLTEIGFISNYSDRKYITSQKGQDQIAGSLFNAFRKYKNYAEGGAPGGVTVPYKEVEEVVVSSNNTASVGANSVIFTVQVRSSSSVVAINSKNFGVYHSDTKMIKHQGLCKYLVGRSVSYKDALSLQSKLRKYKFKDAFLVAYIGDKRISVKEALSIIEKK